MTAARDVARAIDALRRGWPVAVDQVSFLAVETAGADALAAFDGATPASLLISGNRAATLKLTNQLEASPADPVLIRRAPWIDLDAATAIADPALDLANPLKGPFQAAPLCSPPTARAALRLARLAGLLPALFTRRDGPAEARVSADDVMAFGDGADLRIVSRARLPNVYSEAGEIIAFRAERDAAAGPRPFGMPDRRRAGLAQVRLRAAARRCTRRDRRRGLGDFALPAAGGARDRAGQQAARLCPSGSGP